MNTSTDTRLNPNEIPAPLHNGNHMVESHATDEAEFIIRIAARYPLTESQALEIASEAQEHYGGADVPRAEFWRVHGMIERGFLVLRAYSKKGGNRDMAERCLWLLLGFPVLAGADSMVDIIKYTGFSKQTVDKCLKHFQKEMPELPILEGQRDIESRKNMTLARIKQIKKHE